MAAVGPETRGGILTIDLAALTANYRTLQTTVEPAQVAAVVKADAYGLGVAHVAPALVKAGCGSFFVTTIEEGVALRRLVGSAEIHVFNGAPPGTELAFAEHKLTPVLNSLAEIHAWNAATSGHRERFGSLPTDLQVDTAPASPTCPGT